MYERRGDKVKFALFATTLLLSAAAAGQDPTLSQSDSEIGPPHGSAPAGLSFGGSDGAAHFIYPFQLPAAKGRYSPNLYLSYSSQNTRNVGYGVGWEVNTSYIEEDSRASPNSDGSRRRVFRLHIDGAVKVLLPYPAGQSISWRPDVGTGYLRLTKNETTGSWVMNDAMGSVYTFSRLTSTENASFPRWYLQGVVDVDGNTSVYEYATDTTTDNSGASGMLTAVRYNSYGQSTCSALVATCYSFFDAIQLNYASIWPGVSADGVAYAPVFLSEAISDSLVEHSKQLQSIDIVQVNTDLHVSSLIRKYRVTYVNSVATGQSLLSNVSQFGTDGTSAMDTGSSFTYGQSAYAATNSVQLRLPAGVPFNAAWIDLDGDGRPDLVWGGYVTSGLMWSRNVSIGNSSPRFLTPAEVAGTEAWYTNIYFNIPNGVAPGFTRIMDIDGDGRPDFIQAHIPGQQDCGAEALKVYLNQSDGDGLLHFATPVCFDLSVAQPNYPPSDGTMLISFTTTYYPGDGTSADETLADLVDVNGDGIPDYVISSCIVPGCVSGATWLVYQGYRTPSGFGLLDAVYWYGLPGAIRSFPSSADGSTNDFTDLNGDGIPDVIVYSNHHWATYCGQGIGGVSMNGFCGYDTMPAPTWSTDVNAGATAQVLDINRTGFPSLLTAYANVGFESTTPGMPGQSQLSVFCHQAFSPWTDCYPRRFQTVASGLVGSQFVDIDGDGVPDYYNSPYYDDNSGNPKLPPWYSSGSYSGTGNVPIDRLASLTTPFGATTAITYASSAMFGTTSGLGVILPVVVSTSTTGPGLTPIVRKFWYSTPTVTNALVDPARREYLGFSESYEMDVLPGASSQITTHRKWGSFHWNAGILVAEEKGTASDPNGPSLPIITVFRSQSHSYEIRTASTGTCQQGNIASAQFPGIVFDAQDIVSVTDNGLFRSLTKTIACASVDYAGNILQETIDNDNGTPLTIHKTFPLEADGTALCKNCVLEAYGNTPALTTAPLDSELFHRFYYYDAPAQSVEPVSNVLSHGHLNYVKDLTSGTIANGRFQTSPKSAYNVDGTLSYEVSEFFAQDVAVVQKTLGYDAPYNMHVVSETLTDVMKWSAASTPLVGTRLHDPVFGQISRMSGPFLAGSQANAIPTTVYAYDIFGRLTDTGKVVGSQSFALVALGYYQGAVPGRGYSAWEATFTGEAPFPASPYAAALPDVTIRTRFYDGLGRVVQTRDRLGTGPSASAGNVVQNLASQYLVRAVAFDALGRTSSVLDPYYSNSGAYQDITQSGASELGTTGLHATGVGYDPRGRVACTMYKPVSATLPRTPTTAASCISNFSTDASYTRAFATVYSTGVAVAGGQAYFTQDTYADWQNTAAIQIASREYIDASGSVHYHRDRSGNFVGFSRDALGRLTSASRYLGTPNTQPTLVHSVTYDMVGRTIADVDLGVQSGNAPSPITTTSYEYSSTGQLVRVKRNPTSDVPEGLAGVQFIYGSMGRLEKRWSYSWAESGGNWMRTPLDETTPPANAMWLQYDTPYPLISPTSDNVFIAGHLSAQGNDAESTAYGYDRAGNIVTRARTFKDFSPGLVNTVELSLGTDERLLSTTVRSPAFVGPISYYTRYDSAGVAVRVDDGGTNVYWSATDPASSPVGATAPAYDANGRFTGTWLDNGHVVNSYQYDVAASQQMSGMSTQLTQTGGASSLLWAVSGASYAGSRLTGYTDSATGSTYSYGYDADGRLSSSVARGNMQPPSLLSQNIDQTDSHYVFGGSASLWNIQSSTDSLTGNVRQFIYQAADADKLAAATTSVAQPQSAATFKYDAESHLIEIDNEAGVEERLVYDANGALAERALPNKTLLYFGADLTVDSSTGKADVHVLVNRLPIAAIRPSSVLYYHRDQRASVVATSTGGGGPGASYRYGAYGEPDKVVGENSDVASEFGYIGGLKLSEGLLYLNARVYNPQMRRFMQADNVDLRRYTYAGGDPINLSDLGGHDGTGDPPAQTTTTQGADGSVTTVDVWISVAGGAAYGVVSALCGVCGFAPLPDGDIGKRREFQASVAAAQIVTGVAQALGGAAPEVESGVGLMAASGLGELPSGGLSTAGVIGGAVVAADGIRRGGAALLSVGAGLHTLAAMAANGSPTGGGQAETPGINKQKQAGHIEGTPQNIVRDSQGKPTSTFLNPSEANSLTEEGWAKGEQAGGQGNMRTYDFDRPIGAGPEGGFQTRIRVSIGSDGLIHGTPYGPVFEGPLPVSPQ
jgi:RHS repeat-associated protein